MNSQSNPEFSESLLKYIIEGEKLPSYVLVKGHLALIKSTNLESLIGIIGNIYQTYPLTGVGLCRAILEEENENIDEDEDERFKVFENKVLPFISTIILQILINLNGNNDIMKFTIPALDAMINYRNDNNINESSNDDLNKSIISQFSIEVVQQLMVIASKHDNQNLKFMLIKVLNSIYSTGKNQNVDKYTWTTLLRESLISDKNQLDIESKLSLHRSLLQNHEINDILPKTDQQLYLQNLFLLGSQSLNLNNSISFSNFLACWLSLMNSLESYQNSIPIDACIEIVFGWINTKLTPILNNDQNEEEEEEEEDIENEIKLIVEPIAKFSRLNPLPIFENLINKLNQFKVLLENDKNLIDQNYDKLQTLILFASSFISDECQGEIPAIPTFIKENETNVIGLKVLIDLLIQLTNLCNINQNISPNVTSIIWLNFWSRYLKTYVNDEIIFVDNFNGLRSFYLNFQTLLETSLINWQNEEDVIESISETIRSLPNTKGLINYNKLIDTILINFANWPYNKDKSLVKSSFYLISKLNKYDEEYQQLKLKLFSFITNLIGVYHNNDFNERYQYHPYITNIKMGVNALVGLCESVDIYTYLELINIVKNIFSTFMFILKTYYFERIDIILDVLKIFSSILQNLEIGIEFDESLVSFPVTYCSPVIELWLNYYHKLKFDILNNEDDDEYLEGLEVIIKSFIELSYVNENNNDDYGKLILTYLKYIINDHNLKLIENNLKLQSDLVFLINRLFRSYPKLIINEINNHNPDKLTKNLILNITNLSISNEWIKSSILIESIQDLILNSSEVANEYNEFISQLISIPLNTVLLKLTKSKFLKKTLMKFLNQILNNVNVNQTLNRQLIFQTFINNLKNCPPQSQLPLQSSLQSALMGVDYILYKQIINELSVQIANIK